MDVLLILLITININKNKIYKLPLIHYNNDNDTTN